MHTFEPKDPIEVITPHGLGIVVYVTVYGPHANDIYCVANKADGQLRHYQTIQLQLAESGVIGMNEGPKNPKYYSPKFEGPIEILLKQNAALKEDPNKFTGFFKLPTNANPNDYEQVETRDGWILVRKGELKRD